MTPLQGQTRRLSRRCLLGIQTPYKVHTRFWCVSCLLVTISILSGCMWLFYPLLQVASGLNFATKLIPWDIRLAVTETFTWESRCRGTKHRPGFFSKQYYCQKWAKTKTNKLERLQTGMAKHRNGHRPEQHKMGGHIAEEPHWIMTIIINGLLSAGSG